MDRVEGDAVTEALVLGFIELIHERKLAGKPVLAATMATIAEWLSDRTGYEVTQDHVQSLASAMREGGLITVGGGGIGFPNTYDTREREMGERAFWDQVDAFLLAWRLPGRHRIRKRTAGRGAQPQAGT